MAASKAVLEYHKRQPVSPSYQEIAKLCGVSFGTIAYLFYGDTSRPMSETTLRKVLNGLHKELNRLQ